MLLILANLKHVYCDKNLHLNKQHGFTVELYKKSIVYSKNQGAGYPRLLAREQYSLKVNDTHSMIDLENILNNEYIGLLLVGTPPQEIHFMFDTGSSDVWMPSINCTTCYHHAKYDSSKSISYRKSEKFDGNNASFKIDYGSGTVAGVIGTDVIMFGSLEVRGLRFGDATFEDSSLSKFRMDGIFGLGFAGLSRITKPTSLELLARSFSDIPNMFSFFLTSNPADVTSKSMLIYGGYNLSLVSPNATWFYTPVIQLSESPTYWTTAMTHFDLISAEMYSSRRPLSSFPLTSVGLLFSYCSRDK